MTEPNFIAGTLISVAQVFAFHNDPHIVQLESVIRSEYNDKSGVRATRDGSIFMMGISIGNALKDHRPIIFQTPATGKLDSNSNQECPVLPADMPRQSLDKNEKGHGVVFFELPPEIAELVTLKKCAIRPPRCAIEGEKEACPD